MLGQSVSEAILVFLSFFFSFFGGRKGMRLVSIHLRERDKLLRGFLGSLDAAVFQRLDGWSTSCNTEKASVHKSGAVSGDLILSCCTAIHAIAAGLFLLVPCLHTAAVERHRNKAVGRHYLVHRSPCQQRTVNMFSITAFAHLRLVTPSLPIFPIFAILLGHSLNKICHQGGPA